MDGWKFIRAVLDAKNMLIYFAPIRESINSLQLEFILLQIESLCAAIKTTAASRSAA